MTFGRAFHAGNTIWAFIDQNTLPCQTHNNDNKNKKGVTSLEFLPGSSEDTSLDDLIQ